jgi:hypothetical protein
VRAFALLAILTLAGAAPTRSAVQIISTGEHHGDEVPADTPGTWFALVADSGGTSLRRVRVSVTTVKDEILDDGDEMTGKRVDVSPAVEPLVLMRGIRGLKAGRIPTVFVHQPVEGVVDARFRGDSYQFWMECREQPSASEQRQERCALKLRHGSIFQVLAEYSAYYDDGERIWSSENRPTILWAGDLNRDGLLDVLLDTSDHYNVTGMALFLSRAAASGFLLEEVAAYMTTGC